MGIPQDRHRLASYSAFVSSSPPVTSSKVEILRATSSARRTVAGAALNRR